MKLCLPLISLALAVLGCAPPVEDPPPPPPDPPEECTGYPEGAVEPMAVGEVLAPYRWAESIDQAGDNFPLDLNNVPCDDDENREWSRFDHLLFVSVPAW